MEEKEEKGFVFKDSRKISVDDIDGEGADEAAGQGTTQQEQEQAKERFQQASRQEERRGSRPLPSVSLSTFVFSLSSSALVHLGEIPEPETQRVLLDLPMAKQIIDTLGMLQEKTKGNLDPDEDKLLQSVLYDLRMRYVQKSRG